MNKLLETVKSEWRLSTRVGSFKNISFNDILKFCMNYGAIAIKPDLILIAKHCWTDGKETDISDRKPPNCWYIYAAACSTGSPAKRFCSEAPFKTEYVAYYRNGRERVVKWKQLDRK